MNTAVPDRAKFHHMKDGTLEDWTIIGAEVQEFSKTLYQRIIDHLLLLEGPPAPEFFSPPHDKV